MPPKPKYTRQQIVDAALNIVSQTGAQALTAKELGKSLGMSTSPVFTVFDSMQEVQDAVRSAAMERFQAFAHRGKADMPLFKQTGMRMILFAKEEPQLYQLLFMSSGGSVTSFDDIYARLGSTADECMEDIQKTYSLPQGAAKTLFEHTWIHTYGIGVLCATGMCSFPEEQLSDMLTQDFTAMLMLIRAQANTD